MLRFWLYIGLFALSLPGSAALTEDEAALSLGQSYTAKFYTGETSPIWENMTRQMQGALGSEADLRRFRSRVARELGAEIAVLAESVENVQGFRTYSRQARFSKFAAPVIVSFSFDADDRIAGFFVRPQQEPAPSPYLDYDTKAYLRLPFAGEWLVFWGGRTVKQNYHAAVRDQRFAYDFLIVRDGVSHRGDGTRNEQYYCWNQPILAPAPGIVVTVVSDRPDNPPGAMDPRNPPGNHVILDLGNREYALLAHLQDGSVSVGEGDEVLAGQPIGRCGNSGNSSEPHLHLHLQDARTFGRGDGMPAFFNRYRSDGEPVLRGEPVRGEVVSTDQIRR